MSYPNVCRGGVVRVRNLVTIVATAGLIVTAPGPATGQQGNLSPETVAEIEDLIHGELIDGQIPSMTVAVVRGDRIVWEKGFGQANLRYRIPAVPATVYLIGSTFKTMQAGAVLKLLDAGRISSLDDPVNQYLDELEIRREDPENPVTFRHLLTHSSGIPGQVEKSAFPDQVDPANLPYWDRPFQPHYVWGYSLPPTIPEYLQEGLRVIRPPLEEVVYSPIAFTLIAHLIDRLSGKPFMAYVRDSIFEAAGMESTEFVPTPSMVERFSVPYVVDPATGTNVPVGRVKIGIWSTGLVYGTVSDLGRWLIVNLNGGRIDDRQVIPGRLLSEMHSVQFESLAERSGGTETAGYGLGWRVHTRDGSRYISHSGSLPGETALVLGDVSRRIGVALLSNGDRAHDRLRAIARRVVDLVGQGSGGGE